MSVTGESALRRDIDERRHSAAARNQRSSLFQAQFEQISMRRLSCGRSERSQEMSPAVASFSGERREA
jgi:hypothetical protein